LGGAPEELLDVAAPNSSGFEEVPTFNDFAILSDDTVAAAPQSPIDLDQVEEFEFNSVAPEAISDPSSSFADLNEDLERGESFAEPGGEFAPLASSESAIDQPGWGDRDPSEIDFSSTIVEQATDASELDRHDAMLRQELESVDFYIGQGYLDIALDTLEMLERQFEAHPEIEARRRQLRELGQTAAQTEVASADQTAGEEVAPPTAGSDAAPIMIQDEPPVVPPAANPQAVEAPRSRPALDLGLADVFEEFRVAEEAEDATVDDYETHYNMGTAYKEMDLLDEAVREFQSAAALVSGDDGTPRFLHCCNMLGHCFMKKGLPKAAALWFKRGLAAPGHNEDEYQALRYELASAYEQMGDLNRALDTFTEVYSIDVSYRGVGEKLKSLQARTDGKKKR
jgi:tetratricopeptide (TPR) repeat protein